MKDIRLEIHAETRENEPFSHGNGDHKWAPQAFQTLVIPFFRPRPRQTSDDSSLGASTGVFREGEELAIYEKWMANGTISIYFHGFAWMFIRCS